MAIWDDNKYPIVTHGIPMTPLAKYPMKRDYGIWVHQNIPPWIWVDEECIKCKSILLIFFPPPLSLDWDWLNAILLTLLKGPFTYLKVICIYTCVLHISMHTYITHAHNWFFDPWIRQTTEDVCCKWHSLPHNHRFLCL